MTEKLLGKIVKFIQNKMKKQKVRQHLRPSISFLVALLMFWPLCWVRDSQDPHKHLRWSVLQTFILDAYRGPECASDQMLTCELLTL